MILLPPTPLRQICDKPYDLYSASDLITPTTIVHDVDEALNPDNRYVSHYYNYIDYFFKVQGGVIRARTYLDRIKKVTIYLPEGMELEHSDALRVLQYLVRRYSEIRRPEKGGDVRIDVAQTFAKRLGPVRGRGARRDKK
jgi:hypothetical protein